MKFSLKLILIDTKPRTGYYVVHNNELVTIVKTDTKKQTCKLSSGKVITIDQASHLVAKLIGEVTNGDKAYTYSIVHGDYPILVNQLQQPMDQSDDVDESYKVHETYADALIAGLPIPCEGEFETIYAKAEPNEVVEIVDIDIIDKLELYEKPNRVGVITEFNKAKQTFVINLNNNTLHEEPITCKRKDFKKSHSNNTITMIRAKCHYCKRYGC